MGNYYRIKAVLEFDDSEKRFIKRFGKSSTGNIERTICVNGEMPLISLHYTLTKAFGFINEHLHCFKLTEKDFSAINSNKTSEWRSNVGIFFKSPLRNETEDYWCDDYMKGSFNNWRKKKYTYPYPKYEGSYDSYGAWQETIDSYIKEYKNEFILKLVDEEYKIYRMIPFDCCSKESQKLLKNNIIPFDDIPLNLLHDLFEYDINELLDTLTIDNIYKHFNTIIYNYDYGDGWEIKLEISEEKDEYILQQATSSKIPVLVSYEGYNMVEDVGGRDGYISFLVTLFNLKEVNVDDVDNINIIEKDGTFYKWIDEDYKYPYVELSPNRLYGWARSLEWDYHLRYIEDWFK